MRVRRLLQQFHENHWHCADITLLTLLVVDTAFYDFLDILDDQVRHHGMDTTVGLGYIVCYPAFICIGFTLFSLLLLRYFPLDRSDAKLDESSQPKN